MEGNVFSFGNLEMNNAYTNITLKSAHLQICSSTNPYILAFTTNCFSGAPFSSEIAYLRM
jgi:hypothetical protein